MSQVDHWDSGIHRWSCPEDDGVFGATLHSLLEQAATRNALDRGEEAEPPSAATEMQKEPPL